MRRHDLRVLALALLFALSPATALAQNTTTVSGQVTGDDRAPLPYATVSVDARRVSARSGVDGRYTLRVPHTRGDSVTVTARVIGHRARSRVVTLVGVAVMLDFVLPAVPLVLSEVVATGAGTTEIREKLGSVSNSVSGDAIERSNEPNVVNALAAKAPGVTVTSQSGDPGAGSAIFIRGLNTIEGSGQPLFVVDGTPIDNSTTPTDYAAGGTVYTNRAADLNPHDIESVEILKGPAATIYGSRASQGVVLITTKGGKAGPARATLRSSFAWDHVSHRLPLQRSFGQGTDDSAATCDRPGCLPSSTSWGPALPAGTATYDHFGEIFGEGQTADVALELSGGDARRTFFLSAGRLDQHGVIVGPHSWYDRTSVRLKASETFGDRLRVTGNIAYADVRGDFIQKGDNRDGLMVTATRTPPEFDNLPYLDPITGQHRSYRYPLPAALTDDRIYDNPFWVIERLINTNGVRRAFGSVGLVWNPLSWLGAQYLLGADFSSENRLEGFPPSSSRDPTGLLYQANYENLELDHNLLVTLSHAFGRDAAATLTLGQNLNSRHVQSLRLLGTGFNSSEVFTLGNATNVVPQSGESLVHTQAYFLQAGIDLHDQLFLTGALRDEGASTFGTAHRHSLFPKASVAWTFSELLSPKWRVIAEYGRLRAAYGETGREPYPYQIITGYDAASAGGNGGLVTGGERAHPEIGPERTKELEVGADVGLRHHRLDVSVTYYRSHTVNAIFSVPVALSSGYVTQVQNSGEIRNRGWEVTLDLRPVQHDDLQWELGFQWARNRNRVLRLDGADGTPLAVGIALNDGFVVNPHSVLPGYPLGVLTGLDFVRCRYGEPNFQSTSTDERMDVNAICRAANAREGALFIDADGFPITDPKLRVIGDPNPQWTGSVHMAMTLRRRWRLSALVDVRQGGVVWNGTRGALDWFGTHGDTERRATCTPDGCTGNEHVFGRDILPGPVVGPGAGRSVPVGQNWYHDGAGSLFSGGPSAPFTEDGSFVKLREVALAYTLDDAFVRRTLGLASIDVSLAGRNLRTWTSYSGLDPETNVAGSAVPGQGIDYFGNPQTRSVVVTVVLSR
jgi:TonB-linked SusC/RagA family outer membrane protein